jgi:rod shape-determining protein MreD
VALLTANSRRDVEVHSFPLLVSFAVPLLALGLQAYLPLHFWRFGILDLPLIVTVYFAVARRNPIAGTLTGALIGIAQDALTGQPIGINGVSKTIIGFLAASIGVRIDVENHGTRLILNFGAAMLNSAITLLIIHRMLAMEVGWSWIHELIRAVVNSLVALVLFALFDRAKRES